MRLAEMYLVYVEAAMGNNTTSDATAIEYFNKVHTRAGLAEYVVAGTNGSGPLTFDMLLSERFKEFAMEGMSWYDMVIFIIGILQKHSLFLIPGQGYFLPARIKCLIQLNGHLQNILVFRKVDHCK